MDKWEVGEHKQWSEKVRKFESSISLLLIEKPLPYLQ